MAEKGNVAKDKDGVMKIMTSKERASYRREITEPCRDKTKQNKTKQNKTKAIRSEHYPWQKQNLRHLT